jgi:polysaccharide biosynthesis protein PslJ
MTRQRLDHKVEGASSSAAREMLTGGVYGSHGERTPWLLCALCLLMPMIPAYSVLPGPLKGNGWPVKMIAFILLGLLILGFLLVRRSSNIAIYRPGIAVMLVYLFVLLVVYGVGAASTSNPSFNVVSDRYLITSTVSVGVTLYILVRIHNPRHRSMLLGCLAIGLAYCCVLGLMQGIFLMNTDPFLQPLGLVATTDTEGGSLAVPIDERLGAKRAIGTAAHPIEFAVLAAVLVPLAIHFARFAESKSLRILAGLTAVIAALAVPAGVSRSGLIALGAALLIYMWNAKVRALGVAVVGGLSVIFALLSFAPGTADALWATVTNSSEDTSVLERVADYAKVSQTFSDHPIFGLGFGGSDPTVYGYLDNQWLQAIVQGGLVGLFGLIVLAGAAVFGFAAGLRAASNARERDECYAMGAMLIGILASSFTFDLLSFPQSTLTYFIVLGLIWTYSSIPVPRKLDV